MPRVHWARMSYLQTERDISSTTAVARSTEATLDLRQQIETCDLRHEIMWSQDGIHFRTILNVEKAVEKLWHCRPVIFP